ncbi:RNA polymerase sigma factor [Sinorhizobium sp. BG8]|uniref:RNA polymerase sigma factor n=1 Tax=Sinorhizobium sp. BG8 TaxID=2613773 RepID=UPI001FF065D8|nr:RNA polymerase sigma factor [Sinorhizobium sp. BG8]
MIQLLTESYGDLVKHVTRRLGGPVDADDVIQDTYLRIQRIPADTDIQNPRSYLFRMADNVAMDHLRSRAARTRHVVSGDWHDVQSDEASAERSVDYRQRIKILEIAISDLPPRQREAFLMHKFDGLSHSEIAEELGITRSAVEKLIMKALATCRDRLDGLLD